MPGVIGGDGPTQYLDKDGKWKCAVTTEFSMTTPDGQKIDVIKDGKLVEDSRVKANLADRVIQIVWKSGSAPEGGATGGGKEKLG